MDLRLCRMFFVNSIILYYTVVGMEGANIGYDRLDEFPANVEFWGRNCWFFLFLFFSLGCVGGLGLMITML